MMDIYFRIDQLIQLRLQNYGWEEIENILASEYKSEGKGDQSNTVVPKFELGEIVIHKELGYKGVVRGWDYRPTIDCSSEWNLLEKKDDQLFYSVIPYEDDSSLNIAFTKKHAFYVAEESLIKSDPSHGHDDDTMFSDMGKTCFDQFDESTQKYLAKPKLRFCSVFPPSVDFLKSMKTHSKYNGFY